MRRRRVRGGNRALPEVAYLILGYVGAHAEVHGYRLGRLLSASPLGLPSLHLGQVYRLLHELAARGLVRCRIDVERSRPSRRLFALTRAGETAFRRWLAGPARGAAPVRDQLLHRLRFEYLIPAASLRRLLREAARECEADLAGLRTAARRGNGASGAGTTLLSIALEHRLAADRNWLTEAARVVDERTTSSAPPRSADTRAERSSPHEPARAQPARSVESFPGTRPSRGTEAMAPGSAESTRAELHARAARGHGMAPRAAS